MKLEDGLQLLHNAEDDILKWLELQWLQHSQNENEQITNHTILVVFGSDVKFT